MLGISLLKMWHKKWMNLSLLLGCILLVATAVSFPLYQEAAYDRMLQDEFNYFLSSRGEWPAQLNMSIVSKKDKGGASISAMEELLPDVYDDFGVKEKETIYYYALQRNGIHSEMLRNDAEDLYAKLAAKTGIEDHVRMVSGEMYSQTGLTEDGAIEVVISQDCMVKQGYILGETICFDALTTYENEPLRLYIKGVFDKSDEGDFYWMEKQGELNEVCFMNMDLFRSMFTGEKAGGFSINCYYYAMFDYNSLKASDMGRISNMMDYYLYDSDYSSVIDSPLLAELIEDYNNKHSRISATLIILQIPVLIMLAAFLLMISGQMYEMERNEISVIKSRGSSRAQIFRMYLFQGVVLVIGGAALGIPLGMAMSRLLGAARNFLIFDFSEKLAVRFTPFAAIYAGGAMLLGLVCLTVPAIRHSRVSIVNLKQQKALKKKSFWEKIFLDVICIAIAGYGYYNFRRNSASMAESVLTGKALDPLLYLSSSLMIIGLGLLFLRLQPLILKLIFTIGKKRWKPAAFVSFMENVKNGRKQQLIMLFLIMTVSLGMYHSAVARTIVENTIRNTDYKDGCDLVLKEVWTAITDSNGAATGGYVVPDMEKYVSADFIDSYTKVINLDSAKVTGVQGGDVNVRLMGINTKEFGQITYVDKRLLEKHYYEYLNELAVSENGLIVSSNFRDKLGLKVGDTISYSVSNVGSASGVIIDFIDYFPAYAPETMTQKPDGTVDTEANYIVIGHYDYMSGKLGQVPYEIWASLKKDADENAIYDWIRENDVRLTKYINRVKDLDDARSDPLLQGTNGVLTMGFVVTLLLCGVGYLIYWIMALKERELVFGVLRASGFHKKELFHMLINEQIFCGLFSILAGFGIGKLTSFLFVPILQKAYATTDQILPMTLITNQWDLIRLIAVIVTMMTACLAFLTVMLFRMNVAKALKLGEE